MPHHQEFAVGNEIVSRPLMEDDEAPRPLRLSVAPMIMLSRHDIAEIIENNITGYRDVEHMS
jgi:hypothetical protein